METAIKDLGELRGKTKTESSVNSIREAPVPQTCYKCEGKKDMTHNNAILRIKIVETVGKRGM